MPETFDTTEIEAGVGGAKVAGDTFTQSSVSKFLPASYLVFGPADGPYERVDTATPFPVTISGVATAANQTTANTALAAIQAAVQIIDNAIAGSEMQVDIVSGSVSISGTVTVGTHAVTQSGTWTVDLGATDNAVLDAIQAAAEAIDAGKLEEATFTGRLGEVQASPTANTLLARLKTIGDAVTGTLTVGSHAVTNAGTFAVQAAQSGTWNITNVSGTISLPTGAATAANQSTANAALAAIQAAVEILDDWDETDRAKVNIIAGQAGVAAGSGAVGATTQRVVLATDVALPTGSNVIGGVTLATLPDTASGDLAAMRAALTSQITVQHNPASADSFPVGGPDIHDLAVSNLPVGPLGAYASAAAPTIVSDDGDMVRLWALRNGALATVVTAAGALIGGDATNGLDVDVTRVTGTVTIAGAVTNAGTFVVQENGAALTALQIMDDWDNAASDGASVSGDVAHDSADAGEPVKIGYKALAHGANPAAVAANDRTNAYANRAGIPWVIGGHPNVVTKTATVTDSDGAQTNAALVTVSAGTKIVVTRVTMTADGSNTGPVNCRVGFAAATLGAASASGTTGILADFNGIPAGGGVTIGDGSGILGVGADDEDVRFTCEDPAGGAITLSVSYYTIES